MLSKQTSSIRIKTLSGGEMASEDSCWGPVLREEGGAGQVRCSVPIMLQSSSQTPTASISLCRDQDLPITKAGCVAPKRHIEAVNAVCCEFGGTTLLLWGLLAAIQPAGLPQSHQQTGPNQSNVPQ